jgi:hypothetical protein
VKRHRDGVYGLDINAGKKYDSKATPQRGYAHIKITYNILSRQIHMKGTELVSSTVGFPEARMGKGFTEYYFIESRISDCLVQL